jgi:hypothetical protein
MIAQAESETVALEKSIVAEETIDRAAYTRPTDAALQERNARMIFP